MPPYVLVNKQTTDSFLTAFLSSFAISLLFSTYNTTVLPYFTDLSTASTLKPYFTQFRDLKPQNVGFDREGNPVLFDFGLAREVPVSSGEDGPLVYKGMAGSLRYMAPETMLKKFASTASDVYSFGIVLWELCTLQHLYHKMNNVEDFKQAIVLRGHRPSLRTLTHASNIKALLKKCWTAEWKDRPNFTQIRMVLEGFTKDHKQPVSPGRRHAPSQKSTLSIKSPSGRHSSIGSLGSLGKKRIKSSGSVSSKISRASSGGSSRLGLILNLGRKKSDLQEKDHSFRSTNTTKKLSQFTNDSIASHEEDMETS